MDPTLRPQKPQRMRGTPAYFQRIRVAATCVGIGTAVGLLLHFSGFMTPFGKAMEKYAESPVLEKRKFLFEIGGHVRTPEQLMEQREENEAAIEAVAP